jgi:hypothetical protein
MNVRQKQYYTKLNNEIREIENFISRNENTIENLKNSNLGIDYVKRRILKIKVLIDDKKNKLEEKREELKGIYKGLSNDKILEEHKNNDIKNKQIKLNHKKQKLSIKKDKIEKKEVIDKYYKNVIRDSRYNRQKIKDYKYGYKYFNKVSDQLPDYMRKNLKEMPNNKGYIWRGVYFFGELPDKEGPCIMFEKMSGNILVIHEWTDTEYKKYEKKGKERKKLVNRYTRKNKYNSVSLIDYIK